jgi:CYTH domain-containing protein
MGDVPYEIERKFLLAAPDGAVLDGLATSVSHIEQTYLRNDDGQAERVRRRTVRRPGADGETVTLTHTRKVGVSKGVVEEYERELDEAEYGELLQRSDADRVPVVKTRWVVRHDGRDWEVDHLVSPRDLWLMEVELPAADDVEAELEVPPWAHGVREVTGDDAYSNKNLALPPSD